MKNVLTLLLLVALIACRSEAKKSVADANAATDNKAINTTTPAPVTVPTIDALCFVHAVKKDSTIIRLVITGDAVTGSMTWQPNEQHGAIGTLKGKKVGDTITADYAYTIEGSKQVEEKVFILQGDKLLIKSGELMDKNGKSVLKNPAKTTVKTTLLKADCSKLAL